MRKLILLLLACSLPVNAKSHGPIKTALVISQSIDTREGGYAVMPIGTGIVGVPIARQSNIVLLETEDQRLTWVEVGKKAIILPVHGTIQFYRDGDLFIVLDSKGKKHKFALMHMEALK